MRTHVQSRREYAHTCSVVGVFVLGVRRDKLSVTAVGAQAVQGAEPAIPIDTFAPDHVLGAAVADRTPTFPADPARLVPPTNLAKNSPHHHLDSQPSA